MELLQSFRACDWRAGGVRHIGRYDEGVARVLPELLVRNADRAATAIVEGDRELSYAELDTLSNRLARRLIRLGAAPESAIPIVLPRSARWLIAAWAFGSLNRPQSFGAGLPIGADDEKSIQLAK